MAANLRRAGEHPTRVTTLRQTVIAGIKVALGAVLLTFFCNVSVAQKTPRPATAAKPQVSADAAARGKYIVEGVAMCGQCHTPRDDSGAPDRSRNLEGAAVWLVSAEPVADWPLVAPRLAQSPPGTDADMVKLLTTGIWGGGKPLRPPMPQFRMSIADAEAVVAYLKSMHSEPH
jgi:mono/diheme cytochrome c family protein